MMMLNREIGSAKHPDTMSDITTVSSECETWFDMYNMKMMWIRN